MRLHARCALLLVLSACASSTPSPREPKARAPMLANLQRAATLPWTDEGRCAVREASSPWPLLVERCFENLDHQRIEFHDTTGRCAVASAGAVAVGIGICVLAAPEIVVGTVIVTGAVVVGFAIKEAMDGYAETSGHSHGGLATRPVPPTAAPRKRSEPDPNGLDDPRIGPVEITEEDRPRCQPIPVPYHLGGNKLHDACADRIPNNSFPGGDVLVNGKNFDALQLATRTLWEVKTNALETYSPYVLRLELEKQLEEARRERDLAWACGFDFRVGVRSKAHKDALEEADPTFDGLIVVMDWC